MSEPILHLFWVAEYQDGQALPQFDPDTGEEHLFKDVDHSRLKRFGWYAFPRSLANKVENAVVNPLLNSYTVDLPISQSPNLQSQPRLIAYRTTTITFQPSTLSVEHHEADEYVLGLDCGLSTNDYRLVMHIFTDGRVELKPVLERSEGCQA